MDDEKLEREAAKIIFSTQAKPEDAEVVRAKPQGPEVVFVCPFCNATYQVSEDLAGKAMKCRNCRELSKVDAKRSVAVAVSGFNSRSFWLGVAARSFWLGVAVGGLVTAIAAALLKVAHII
jgi:hypothetical protein